jgi:acetyltransferase
VAGTKTFNPTGREQAVWSSKLKITAGFWLYIRSYKQFHIYTGYKESARGETYLMDAVNSFTNPKSLAVIGASNTPGKIGNAIVINLIKSGYKGKIYPINPKEKVISGLPCFASLADVPGDIEMAIFCIPARKAMETAEECGKKGIKNLVVITAGFKEIGRTGAELEKEFMAVCSRYNMRVLGPNVVGFIDTHTPINATFLKGFPPKGEIAFISQSGAILASILDWSQSAGIGYSKIYSLGNKADLSEVDFIAEAADDPNTKVILCYIEDVSHGPEFLKVVSEATRKKPVVILKSGTSQSGPWQPRPIPAPWRAATLLTTPHLKDAASCGYPACPSFLTWPYLLSTSRRREGDRVAIVTNSGGPGIIATDKVEAHGLQMARFTRETIEELRSYLPAEAGIYNPVDVLGDAKADRFRFALDKVFKDENVDSVVLLLCPVAVTEPLETARALIDFRRLYPDKTVVSAYMGGKSLAEGAALLSSNGIPCFTMPEPLSQQSPV